MEFLDRLAVPPPTHFERLYFDVRNISEVLDGLGRVHRNTVGGWLSTSPVDGHVFLVGALAVAFGFAQMQGSNSIYADVCCHL